MSQCYHGEFYDDRNIAIVAHALAVRQGAGVRFVKTSRVLADLAGGHADRTWDKRIKELIRPDVLILDDFAMRQLTANQADDLYGLVSERQGRSMVITSNRATSDGYPLFPNPVVAESLLDRVINNSHQVIMNGPSYRPSKRPKSTAKEDSPTTKQTPGSDTSVGSTPVKCAHTTARSVRSTYAPIPSLSQITRRSRRSGCSTVSARGTSWTRGPCGHGRPGWVSTAHSAAQFRPQ